MSRPVGIVHKLLAVLLGLSALAFVALTVVSPLRVPRNLIDEVTDKGVAAKKLADLTVEARRALMQREVKRLRDEPLDATALVNLWVLKNLDGDEPGSRPFALEAAKRSLRDPMAQLVAIRANLENKDLAQAFQHLDGMLTSNPEMDQELYPSILQLLGSNDAVAKLSMVLKRNPPWRNPFLIWLIRNDSSGQIVFRVFSEIRKAGGIVADGELRAYLAWLLQQKSFEKGYFVWLDSLDERALLKVAGIFDGQFDLDSHNLTFDWNIDQAANAEISISQRADAPGNRNLRLQFYNSSKPFGHVYQYLRLRPGKHKMTGEWSANNFSGPAGLQWKLTCAERSGEIGQSEAFNHSAPWSAFTAEFEVPADECQTQLLRLQSASDAVLDVKLDGEVRFDNMSIQPNGNGGEN
jgi:hypothetical protein